MAFIKMQTSFIQLLFTAICIVRQIFLRCFIISNSKEQTVSPVHEKNLLLSWVDTLSKEVLKANLRALKLKSTGTVDELRERFYTYLQSLSSPVSEFPDTSKQNTSVIQSDISTTCNQVHKWELNFCGKTDPISFIERLLELKECYNIQDSDMLTALPLVFQEDALLWYRNQKSNWSSWQTFLDDFKMHFLHPNYYRLIEDEIHSRYQRPEESFRDFLTSISTLIRRGKPISVSEKYDRIYNNMLPKYKLYIHYDSKASITELIRRACEYEGVLEEQKKFALSLPKYMANQNSHRTTADRPHDATHKNDTSFERKIHYDSRKGSPQVQQHSISFHKERLSQPSQRCWRCSEIGHVRNSCRNPSKLFCGRCGMTGILGRDCRCQEIVQQRRFTSTNSTESSARQIYAAKQKRHDNSVNDSRQNYNRLDQPHGSVQKSNKFDIPRTVFKSGHVLKRVPMEPVNTTSNDVQPFRPAQSTKSVKPRMSTGAGMKNFNYNSNVNLFKQFSRRTDKSSFESKSSFLSSVQTPRPDMEFIGHVQPKRTKNALRNVYRLCCIHVGREKLVMTKKEALDNGLLRKL